MSIRVIPRGAFDLTQSLAFGFGQRDAAVGEDVMRLAFVLDGSHWQVGVAVRQSHYRDGGGVLEMEVTLPDLAADGGLPARLTANATEARVVSSTAEIIAAATAQAARVLSVDIDATGWDALGARDELIGRLQAARPGMRPPLFYSAYEALCWSVLSARRPARQMATVRDAIAAEFGATVEVAGRTMPVWLTPRQLLALESYPGLPEIKLQRLHGVARAALAGDLDTGMLRALDPVESAARLQRLQGIGPFYAQLVVIRTLGHTDVLATGEPRLLAIAGEVVGAPGPLSGTELARLAAPWSPWQTWATVALRAAGVSLLAESRAELKDATQHRDK